MNLYLQEVNTSLTNEQIDEARGIAYAIRHSPCDSGLPAGAWEVARYLALVSSRLDQLGEAIQQLDDRLVALSDRVEALEDQSTFSPE